ncbi:MAG: acetoin utilization protein AcuC [Alphaproteobacteria bacterium]
MSIRPRFIGSDIYRRSRYGGKHPLAIPRVSAAIDLCRAMGWLADADYIDSPIATPDQLARFHTRDYIDAVIRAERDQAADESMRARHHLGINGNPVFGEVFRRPATACGASLLAAELLRDGGVIYSPAGGTHHGRPDRASGFCFFNDPALGLLAMLDQGIERICYVDIDAHHGDGVEDAFADDPRVTTISVHEAGRWPRTGDRNDGARGIFNFPVPERFDDGEFALVLEQGILPIVAARRPEAIVLQCGADALAEDPLSRLTLSNNAHWRAVAALRSRAPRYLVLGGGGYNPWAVARCWSGVWATLNDFPIPERLPAEAESVLRSLAWSRTPRDPPEHWLTTLRDAPRDGPVRRDVLDLVKKAAQAAATG